MEHYDMMIHLGGEHMHPNLVLSRLLQVSCNVVIVSPQTRVACERFMRAAMRTRNNFSAEVKQVEVDNPHDPVAVTECMNRLLATESSRRVVVNITGGTKPMAFAALSCAGDADLPCVYLDSEKRLMHRFDGAGWTSCALAGAPPPMDIDDFVILSGNELENSGLWEDVPLRAVRSDTTRRLWKIRQFLQQDQAKMLDIAEKRNGIGSVGGRDKLLFAERVKGGVQHLSLKKGDDETGVGEWNDFWTYLAGTWLEEYTYLCLRPLAENGAITDLRIDLTLRGGDRQGKLENPDAKPTLNQIDVAFTDGWLLWIVECKAGRCTQEHVQKLENLTRRIGGIHGRGCLLLIGDPDARGRNGVATAINRVRESRSNVFCVRTRRKNYSAKDAASADRRISVSGEFGKALRNNILQLQGGWCCEIED